MITNNAEALEGLRNYGVYQIPDRSSPLMTGTWRECQLWCKGSGFTYNPEDKTWDSGRNLNRARHQIRRIQED
jgi:hypothetical protein